MVVTPDSPASAETRADAVLPRGPASPRLRAPTRGATRAPPSAAIDAMLPPRKRCASRDAARRFSTGPKRANLQRVQVAIVVRCDRTREISFRRVSMTVRAVERAR